MKFNPEKYNIPDEPGKPFIDVNEIKEILSNTTASRNKVAALINKSLSKKRLNLFDTAVLLNANDKESIKMIKEGASKLKTIVYGNRIVLFAPLYIGNKCQNDCKYCGFRASNKTAIRKTLSPEEIHNEVIALEDAGQKRLILVFGEHPEYSPDYIAETVKQVYTIKNKNGEIRRVNINAAPMDVEGFRKVKKAGIGTYQIFQETYHPEYYKKYHLKGKKADYNNRLTSLDRAFAAGIDDVGIGALFGLYDWRFEVMSLLRHVNHFEACFNVGPHTISFPRLKQTSMPINNGTFTVNDEDFTRLVAILRLAVPYTGMILTAREPAEIRNEVLKYGVSQIDAGTKIEIGAYSSQNKMQDLNREQFKINDDRSLNEVIDELVENNYIPSFCTACYRLNRTGEHFMEFSVPGFIKRFCTPNAILTLTEYLVDYAPEETKEKGWKVINNNLHLIENEKIINETRNRIEQIKSGKRDLYF